MQRSDLSDFSPSEKRQGQANAPSCRNMHVQPTPLERTWYILEHGIESLQSEKKYLVAEKRNVNFILHRCRCFRVVIFMISADHQSRERWSGKQRRKWETERERVLVKKRRKKDTKMFSLKNGLDKYCRNTQSYSVFNRGFRQHVQ